MRRAILILIFCLTLIFKVSAQHHARLGIFGTQVLGQMLEEYGLGGGMELGYEFHKDRLTLYASYEFSNNYFSHRTDTFTLNTSFDKIDFDDPSWPDPSIADTYIGDRIEYLYFIQKLSLGLDFIFANADGYEFILGLDIAPVYFSKTENVKHKYEGEIYDVKINNRDSFTLCYGTALWFKPDNFPVGVKIGFDTYSNGLYLIKVGLYIRGGEEESYY